LFNTGDVLTAAQVNTYLNEQTVMVFADSAARTTALTSVLAEGMVSYLQDTNAVEVYNGTAWVSIAADQTPLTTKGDLFTFSTVDARLAVGNSGETLVADSAATTGLRWQGNYAAGKNKIINGAFDIWQRGTSFTNQTTNAFTADRWRVTSSNSTIDVTQSTFTPGTAPVAGYEGQYFATLAAEATDTDARFQQAIEDVRTFAGQTITVSFWAKSTVTTDALRWIRYQQSFGSGGSSVVNTDSAAITLTSSWVRYSVNIAVPSISSKTIGTGSFVNIIFGLKASTAQTLDLWGVQVEAGNVATAFQTATGTLQGELAACQRYYFRINGGQAFYPLTTGGFSNTTTTILAVTPFPTEMRIAPTALEQSGTAANYGINESGGGYTCSAVPGFNAATKTSGAVQFTVASGLTIGRGAWGRNDNNSTAFLAWSAEL
jgi:hypothetical protein